MPPDKWLTLAPESWTRKANPQGHTLCNDIQQSVAEDLPQAARVWGVHREALKALMFLVPSQSVLACSCQRLRRPRLRLACAASHGKPWMPSCNQRMRSFIWNSHTQTYIMMYIASYIVTYIYMSVCMRVCVDYSMCIYIYYACVCVCLCVCQCVCVCPCPCVTSYKTLHVCILHACVAWI